MFEDDYGKLPERISCGNVTVSASALGSLISSGFWIDDSAISAFLGLLDSEETVTFDATFVTMLKRAIHHKSIESSEHFLKYYYSSRGIGRLRRRLARCKIVLIPLFNGDYRGNGNHWGLAVLQKETSRIYLYDSSESLQSFTDSLPKIKEIANSVCSRHGINSSVWPQDWYLSQDFHSVQQHNADDCDMFTMLNAFFSSRGEMETNFQANDLNSRKYRRALTLCLLESNLSFLE